MRTAAPHCQWLYGWDWELIMAIDIKSKSKSEQNKAYHSANREQIKICKKVYYAANKDHILEDRREVRRLRKQLCSRAILPAVDWSEKLCNDARFWGALADKLMIKTN
jgi:hypothetical protein